MRITLTGPQIEMLRFFALDQVVQSARMGTCDALIARGLIGWDERSRRYRITELGQAVAALVVRCPTEEP